MEKKKREKTGGRQKGTPNKVTQKTREMITDFVNGNFDRFLQNMNELEARDYCRVYLDMCKHVIPTLQSVSVDEVVQVKTTIEDKIKELIK